MRRYAYGPSQLYEVHVTVDGQPAGANGVVSGAPGKKSTIGVHVEYPADLTPAGSMQVSIEHPSLPLQFRCPAATTGPGSDWTNKIGMSGSFAVDYTPPVAGVYTLKVTYWDNLNQQTVHTRLWEVPASVKPAVIYLTAPERIPIGTQADLIIQVSGSDGLPVRGGTVGLVKDGKPLANGVEEILPGTSTLNGCGSYDCASTVCKHINNNDNCGPGTVPGPCVQMDEQDNCTSCGPSTDGDGECYIRPKPSSGKPYYVLREDGQFVYPIVGDKLGEQEFVVAYHGDGVVKYKSFANANPGPTTVSSEWCYYFAKGVHTSPAPSGVTVFVDKRFTAFNGVVANPVKVPPLGETVITGTLVDEMGEPVVGTVVRVLAGAFSLAEGVTDVQGAFSAKVFWADVPATIMKVDLVFDGGDYHHEAAASVALTSEKAPTVVELAQPMQSVYIGKTISYSGKLTTTGGAGLSGVVVGVFIDGSEKAKLTTTEGGAFTFNLTFPAEGLFTLSVVYDGSDKFQGDDYGVQVVASEEPPEEFATQLAVNFNLPTRTVTAMLTSKGPCLAGQTLHVKVDGQVVGTMLTDQTGSANKALTMTTGKHTIVVAYSGHADKDSVCKVSQAQVDVDIQLLDEIPWKYVLGAVGALVGIATLVGLGGG